MASDGRVHRALVLLNHSVDNGLVAPRDGVLLELFGQAAVGQVVFTGDDHPGGVHVDAVDNSGAHDPVDTRELAAAVV